MKKHLLLLTAVSLLVLGACERAPESLIQDQADLKPGEFTEEIIPGQYIVLLKDGATGIKTSKKSYPDAQLMMAGEMKKILSASDISPREPIQVYTAGIEGFAVSLNEKEAETLADNVSVMGIWPDKLVTLAKPAPAPTPLPDQVTPPGITRVGGGSSYSGGKKAWIIDTGIDLDHPELNVAAASGKTFVSRTTTPDDDNGHGTHCAGIVAAIDNAVGVVGVVPGAAVVPVKVLDKRGSGAMSVIIAGVDFVTANGSAGDAVNMSLGGGVYEPLDLKVIGMGAKGLFVALAAGNESDDAINHSPARANGLNVYTISACDVNDVWAYFSNYGTPVDYCAPGVSILSTYKGGGLASMSGTSMAAPHACGILLATAGNPSFLGYVSGDPDGNTDKIIHK